MALFFPSLPQQTLRVGLLVIWVMLSQFLLASTTSANVYNLEDNIILHAKRGELLMSRRRMGEAVEEFKIALKLNHYSSLSATLYNNMGLCYLGLRDYPLSITSFQHAIKMQPNFDLYYTNLVRAYAQAKLLTKAEVHLLDIVTLNPDDAEAWYLLGLVQKKQGVNQLGKAAFMRYMALQPNSPLAKKLKQTLPR